MKSLVAGFMAVAAFVILDQLIWAGSQVGIIVLVILGLIVLYNLCDRAWG